MNYDKKNKHMMFDDRIEIQECLNKGMTFKRLVKESEHIYEEKELDETSTCRKFRQVRK